LDSFEDSVFEWNLEVQPSIMVCFISHFASHQGRL
jgi:hypothetical protein